MTYIELIVVLSIFSATASIVMFNYGDFQAKVDIKNLTSDIALKIVEAQKESLSGRLPPRTTVPTWKPSYGIYMNIASDNKSFIYFTDLDQNGRLANPNCAGTSECLDKISITKGNYIDIINRCSNVNCSSGAPIANPLAITFKRPDSKAIFYQGSSPLNLTGSEYVQITVKSPNLSTAKIKVYPSGRIQVD